MIFGRIVAGRTARHRRRVIRHTILLLLLISATVAKLCLWLPRRHSYISANRFCSIIVAAAAAVATAGKYDSVHTANISVL